MTKKLQLARPMRQLSIHNFRGQWPSFFFTNRQWHEAERRAQSGQRPYVTPRGLELWYAEHEYTPKNVKEFLAFKRGE